MNKIITCINNKLIGLLEVNQSKGDNVRKQYISYCKVIKINYVGYEYFFFNWLQGILDQYDNIEHV